MSVLPFGLGSTRYGVRLGSTAPSDAGNTATPFPLAQNPNWGQGTSPYADGAQSGYSAGELPVWTAMPYLRPSSSYLFDYNPVPGTWPAAACTTKMAVPQDILLARAQAVDTSRQHAVSAFYGLGAYGAVGATMAPNRYGVSITSYMLDVSAECMLAAADINAYRATMLGAESGSSIVTPKAGPNANYDALSVVPVYTPGPWLTAAEMFSNAGIYAYVGQRDDDDTILGVQAFANMSLSRLSYSFSVGAGLTRSIDLIGPWSTLFSRKALKAWYATSHRYRLVTPGLQITNTLFTSWTSGPIGDFKYNTGLLGALQTGGELMGRYGYTWNNLAPNYFTSAADASISGYTGSQLAYVPSTAANTAFGGGWGFLPPPGIQILGGTSSAITSSSPVYMPSMSVGKDCFLDIAYYNKVNESWQWASYDIGNQEGETVSGPVVTMAADSATASYPGGLLRIQAFTINGSSRGEIVDEFGNRAASGVVAEPPTVVGSFAILDTEVSILEQALYQMVKPQILQGTVSISGTAATVNAGPTNIQNGGSDLDMYDLEQPNRCNMVLTVATPGAFRCAMLRFVVPNCRVSSSSKRVMVNGVAARQYAFLCEDGNVATANAYGGTSPVTGFYACGNVTVNSDFAGPEGYGLLLGNNGGDTGGFAVQSFYCPAL